ncbi:protein Wnt-6-like [Homarus americanus]|uniref:protein Wnt-6-like n=1 Tax=Homarus americanus TaxID=6706 RepID=UPI001C4840E9|nr:protein Wnt-6-like [Homarus americanus]
MAPKFLLLCLLLSLFLSDLVDALWWSLGNRAIMDHSRICRKRGRRLSKDPQSIICRKQPMFQLILEGAQAAMKECQFQFASRRWNCSDNRRSLKKILSRDTPETAFLNAIVSAGVTHELTAACSRGDLPQCSCSRNSLGAVNFGKKKKKPKSEKRKKFELPSRRKQRGRGGKKRRRKEGRGTSDVARRNRRRRVEAREERQWTPNFFDNSLAERDDTVTRPGRPLSTNEVAERKGMASGEAGMVPEAGITPGMPGASGEEWHWSGCDDNVGFGYRMARDFMDWRYLRRRESRDIRSIVMLWNNEAGRRAVKNNLVLHCKCHGLSGSCTHRTCWRRMPSFRSVGIHLKEKFNSAIKVIPSNDGETVIPETESAILPKKQDLVFLEDSPSFCSVNKRTGSLGTHGRVCNATTSDGLSDCELLCCGRGYTQEEHWVEENCRCRFTYCCEVTCQKCRTKKVTSYCR